MTITFKLILALGLPWLLGTLWLNLVIPSDTPSRRALVLGYGYLVGFFAVTIVMRSVDLLGLPLTSVSLLPPMLLLIALAAIIAHRLRPSLLHGPGRSPALLQLTGWPMFIGAALLVLIAARLGGLWLEVYWRPLFPWDAFMHWATKAKVWTHMQSITPFVDYDTWLALGGDGVFTDRHPGYPKTVPLIQTWMNLVLGSWDESLMNLPWVLLLAAGALAFFAQARIAQVGPVAALLFVYLLVSLPMLNLQVALAGYADIYVGIFYLAAVMAFFQWSTTGARWQALLTILVVLAMPMLKNEGLYWSLTLLVALVALRLPRAWLAGLTALGAFILLLVLFAFPRDLVVAGNSLASLNIQLRPEALAPLLRSLFVLGNWHLLFWLISALVVARVVVAWRSSSPWPKPLLSLGMGLASGVVLLFVLFLMTKHAYGAVRLTGVSRITLQLAPALLFFSMMVWQDLARNCSRTSTGPVARYR